MATTKLDTGTKNGIRWLMGRVHVGTPAEEVADDMRARAKRAGHGTAMASAIVRFALAEHERNGQEYAAVMSGRFSSLPRRRSK